MHNRWAVAGVSFALWALVAASAVYWALKFGGQRAGASAPVATVQGQAGVDSASLVRLLGANPAVAGAPTSVSLATRFVLTGVVAGRSRRGAALIAVDGQPPKPYRVGATLAEGVVLQSVQARRAVLAASSTGPALTTLELPLRK